MVKSDKQKMNVDFEESHMKNVVVVDPQRRFSSASLVGWVRRGDFSGSVIQLHVATQPS